MALVVEGHHFAGTERFLFASSSPPGKWFLSILGLIFQPCAFMEIATYKVY
jgi:hypothetical protein